MLTWAIASAGVWLVVLAVAWNAGRLPVFSLVFAGWLIGVAGTLIAALVHHGKWW